MPKKQHTGSYRHLNQQDRDRMEALINAGEKQKTVAAVLKVDPGTISRELKRKRKNGRYEAAGAQHKASVRRGHSKYQGMKVEGNPLLRRHIIQ